MIPISPSDSDDLPEGKTKGIYIGTSGSISVIMASGNARVLPATLVSGVIHPISVLRVLETGTSASGLMAVY